MSNETWPDGSPRDSRFRQSKTGSGWIFDGPEGPKAVGDWIDARQVQRAMEADEARRAAAAAEAMASARRLTAAARSIARAEAEAAAAKWVPWVNKQRGVVELDYEEAQQAFRADVDRFNRRHYIDRDRSVDGCPKAPQAPKEPNGS